MTRSLWNRIRRWLLPAIIVLYLALGVLYALYTPAWQAPDEPAHYNYVQYLTAQRRFPILKLGDYPADYLEEIKAAHFPPEMSIAPIRYEFHQPPLYYLLAVPIYALFDGALLPLRMFSLATGILLLLVTFWIVQAIAPNLPYLAYGATAFVAFLPMHLAMTAAANNDTLAELLLALNLLLSIHYVKGNGALRDEGVQARQLLLLGITTGLALVTKSSIYVVLPLSVVTIATRHLWLERGPSAISRSVKAIAIYLIPAVGLAIPWWLRNMAIYGGLDFLGLGRHDQVVLGQLRTADFVATHGLIQLVRDFATTSFRSFWGQFGWMGVLLDQRVYQMMAVLTILAVLGFALWAARIGSRRTEISKDQWATGSILFLLGLSVLSSYAWYNLGFLQHQGRYLFRALIPVGLAVALGWREALRPRVSWTLAAIFLISAVVLRFGGVLSNWPTFLLVCATAVLAIRRFLPSMLDPVVHAAPYVSLIVLDVISLFLFIVPQLAV